MMKRRKGWYLAPGYMEDPVRAAHINGAIARLPSITEAEIRRLVRTTAQRAEQAHEDYWMLTVLEERAVPYLLEALDDPSMWGAVWEWLDPFAPAEAFPKLLSLYGRIDDYAKQGVICAIGSLGMAACAEPVRAAIQSEDGKLRDWAVIGVRNAVASHRLSPALAAAIFDDVGHVIDVTTEGLTDAADLLLCLDRERAVAFMTDRSRWRITHPMIGSIVRALAAHRAVVPAKKVLAMLAKAERRGDATTLGNALLLLALSGDPSAESWIQRFIASDDEYIRGLAADAFVAVHGIAEAYQVAIAAWSRAKSAADLPEPLRHYATVSVLRNEVANGSFDQYFFNDYCRDAQHALAGLNALGAVHSAEALRQMLSLFGSDGPSSKRETRHRQLEALDNARVAQLSDDFLANRDRLEVLLAQHAARHKKHFVQPQA